MSEQKYDEAFRRNAVQLVESGQRGAQMVRDLGVPASLIYSWCAKYRRGTSQHGTASENQSDVAMLRKELSLARMIADPSEVPNRRRERAELLQRTRPLYRDYQGHNEDASIVHEISVTAKKQ